MRKYLVKKCKSQKLKSAKPYIDELTVFIKVKMDNLKEFSISIPLNVNKKVKNNKDIINAIIDKKYLQISFNLKNSLENKCLLTKIFFGLLYDNISLIEYLNKE